MGEKGEKNIKKTAAQIGIGLFIAVVIIAARPFSFYKMIELKLLDQRFLIRGEIPINPNIGTIDINALTLQKEGRYQDWTRDKYAEVIRILSELDVRMIGFDIFFPEESASDILRKEDYLKAEVNEPDDIFPLFRNYDEELSQAMEYAGNIVLGQSFMEAEHQDPEWVKNNTIEIEDSLKKRAVDSLKSYSKEYPESEWTNSKLPMYIDIEPPIPKLVNASRGTGFAMTAADIDGSVRHYPVILVYDGKIWPSLALMMFLEYIGVDFKDVEIIPGKEIILPPGKLPDGTDVHVKIPINDKGLMMVNWAGDYWHEQFFHIPHYALIQNNRAWQKARASHIVKKIFAEKTETIYDFELFLAVLEQYNVEPTEIMLEVFGLLSLCTQLEELINEGYEAAEDEGINIFYQELLLNHKIAALLRENHEITFLEMVEKLGNISEDEVRKGYYILKEIIEKEGLKPEHYPLYFFEPEVDGKIITDEDFKGKFLIYGLTAAGTWDLNPMPFNRRYPMVGLHANIFNTILTQNFLRELPLWINIFVLICFGLLMGILVPRFKPFRGAVLMLVILGGFLVTAQYLFQGRGLWIEVFGPVLVILIGYTSITVYNFFSEEKEKKMIRGMFSRYVTKSVVDELIKNPDMVKLGGEKKVLTVFFSDVAGFTSVSEKLTPEELVSLLNEYLTAMTEIIQKYEGMIDKYEGDAIMAVFGTPIMYEDHATRACYVSLEMQEELVKLRSKWKEEGRPELQVRIGLNTGPMVAGNMGAASRLDYTVMGDSVNLGARLEGANKQYNTLIMISEFTYEVVKNDIEARFLDSIRVKGKNLPVKVYELLGRKDNGIPESMENMRTLYEQGIEKYLAREWDTGLEFLNKALAIKPDDGPSNVYVKRCLAFKENPPPDDWDGVFTMESK